MTERLKSSDNRGYSEGHAASFKRAPGASERPGRAGGGSEDLGVAKRGEAKLNETSEETRREKEWKAAKARTIRENED